MAIIVRVKPSNKWVRRVRVLRHKHAKRLRSSGIQNLAAPSAVFIHVPKVAGKALKTWIEANVALMRFRTPSVPNELPSEPYVLYTGHLDTDYLVDVGVYSAEALEEAFSFGFVRNPYDRIHSLFRHNLRNREIPEMTFSEYLTYLVDLKPGAYPGLGRPSRFRGSPMTTWLQPLTWSGPKRLFRYEEYETAILEIGSHFGLKGAPPVTDQGEREASVSITKKDQEKILELFQEDFVAFGYSDEPPERFELRGGG